MSKEGGYRDYSSFGYDSEMVEFMSRLNEDMTSGVKFNKENLARRIKVFNKKYSADLRAY